MNSVRGERSMIEALVIGAFILLGSIILIVLYEVWK